MDIATISLISATCGIYLRNRKMNINANKVICCARNGMEILFVQIKGGGRFESKSSLSCVFLISTFHFISNRTTKSMRNFHKTPITQHNAHVRHRYLRMARHYTTLAKKKIYFTFALHI